MRARIPQKRGIFQNFSRPLGGTPGAGKIFVWEFKSPTISVGNFLLPRRGWGLPEIKGGGRSFWRGKNIFFSLFWIKKFLLLKGGHYKKGFLPRYFGGLFEGQKKFYSHPGGYLGSFLILGGRGGRGFFFCPNQRFYFFFRKKKRGRGGIEFFLFFSFFLVLRDYFWGRGPWGGGLGGTGIRVFFWGLFLKGK